MAAGPSGPDDVVMPRSRDTSLPDADEQPSSFTIVALVAAIVVGVILVFAVVLPAVAWLLSLALPIGLVLIGAHLVSRERVPGSSSMARVGGWVALALGALWLLSRLGVL
jgi:hypothetical protein